MSLLRCTFYKHFSVHVCSYNYICIIMCTYVYVCVCVGESSEDRIKRLKAKVAADKGL